MRKYRDHFNLSESTCDKVFLEMHNFPSLSKGHSWFNTISIAVHFFNYFLLCCFPVFSELLHFIHHSLQRRKPFSIINWHCTIFEHSIFLCSASSYGNLLLFQPKLNCFIETLAPNVASSFSFYLFVVVVVVKKTLT